MAGAIAPIPTSEGSLCRYVAFLAKDNLKHQTINTYLSVVRHMHIVAGKGDLFKEDIPLLREGLRVTKHEIVSQRPAPGCQLHRPFYYS